MGKKSQGSGSQSKGLSHEARMKASDQGRAMKRLHRHKAKRTFQKPLPSCSLCKLGTPEEDIVIFPVDNDPKAKVCQDCANKLGIGRNNYEVEEDLLILDDIEKEGNEELIAENEELLS